jgi:molybdenum cofactor cytidylyltransferase
MKFERVPLGAAEGHILGHNVSHQGRRVLKKGRRLGARELGALAEAGHDHVYVAMLAPDDVEEDRAALRIGHALAAQGGLLLRPAYGGRASLVAPGHGVLEVARDALLALNSLDGVTLATLPGGRAVAPSQPLGTLKVIPFALPEATVAAAETIAARRPIAFRAIGPRRITILVSGAASRREKLFEPYRASLAERLSGLGQGSVGSVYVELAVDPERELARAIAAELDTGVELLIIVGETATMDADDLAPRAIARAGGSVDVVGAPVFPGNLLLLAHRGPALILGAPGCVRSRARNVVDLILPRLLLGERLGRHDVAELGDGGLLDEAGGGATEEAGPDARAS